MEVDELVVVQMQRLKLSHLVTTPNVEMPLAEKGGSPGKGKRLAILNNVAAAPAMWKAKRVRKL